MSGRRLARELDALARKFDVALTPRRVPLLLPVDAPQVMVGLGSTLDIDCTRMQFEPRAFGELQALPPLLFDHEEPAGRIELSQIRRLHRLLVVAVTLVAWQVSAESNRMKFPNLERLVH